MKFRVLYSKNYIERDVFTILIDEKYFTNVYRSSGLNGGRKGRILPYSVLKSDRPSLGEMMSGISYGYIYKKFLFEGRWFEHRKHPEEFNMDIANFLYDIEMFLEDVQPEFVPYDHIERHEDLLPWVKEINEGMKEVSKNYAPFDWSTV